MSDEHRVVSSTRRIAALTLLSRVLGLLREGVYAHFFGTGALLSAFRIAFMVPNLARRLFGEGALSAAFIPVFTRSLRDPDPQRARRLAGGALTLLTAILGVLVLVIEIGLLIAVAKTGSLPLRLTAIMLPFMALICVTAFVGGLLNVLGRFAAPAFAPVLLNTFVIVAIVVGARFGGLSDVRLIHVACYAVLVAGVAQVGLQFLSLRAAKFRVTFNRDWSQPDLREIIGFMLPMIVGLSAVQVNTLLDMLIVYFFLPDEGGPAALGYAHFLYQLPLGVFGIALATAIFPRLAARAADDDMGGVAAILQHGVRLAIFVALPATVGLILVARPLVMCFERGAFGAAETDRVVPALICYTLGLCAYSVQHILVRVFYSLKEHRTAARVAVSVVAVNLVLNLLLVGPLAEAGVALATAITALLQVVWLAVLLRRRLPPLDGRRLVVSACKTVLATAVMGICVWFVAANVAGSPVVRLAVAVPVGVAVFGVVAKLTSADELKDLLARNRT